MDASNQGAIELQREQQQQRDQQREDAERLCNSKPEDQVAELALCSRRIAKGGGKIIAENDADADTRSAHANAGDACTDVLCCDWIHDELLFVFERAFNGPGE